ncbi:MAG: hypothetical protein QNJ64_09875 [Crocosphaera sp.]|nr:hypothetical protein [Crocosphaera sp.]
MDNIFREIERLISEFNLKEASNLMIETTRKYQSCFHHEVIENSFNTLAESNMNDDLKNKLDELLKAITEVSKEVTDSEDIETVEILTEDANTLVEKATDDPKSSRVKIYLKRLEETATSLGKIAAPILTIAKGISTLL